MNILGITLIFILPYMAGLIYNVITRQKEANQIETYLIGFFSVFLIQGIIFSLLNYLGLSYELVSKILTYSSVAIVVLGLLVAIIGYKPYVKSGLVRFSFRKEERLMFVLMIVGFILVILRIVMLYGYGRDDIMLETVRVNVSTHTINAYNPLTSRPYELGLINSKKLVSLSSYYSYICMTYGIQPRVLLYLVCAIQTICCMYFACMNTMHQILNSNYRMYTYTMFLGVFILSGDYMKGKVGYKILWNGYVGDTIVAVTMLPYIIYTVMCLYRIERGDFGQKKMAKRISKVLNILLCLVASVFMTSIPTGALLIILSIVAIIVVCTIRFGREEKLHE